MSIPVRSLRAGVLALIAAAGVLQGSTAMASGVIQQTTVKPYPSLPGKPWTFTTYYGAFSAYDGTPLNCTFTHKINDLKKPETDPDNNGGHFHFEANRPLSFQNKPLQHTGDLDPSAFGVAGFTSLSPSQRYGKVVHEMPEVSGNLAGESSLVLPHNWFCVGDCYTSNSWRWNDTYDIGIRNLASLPDLPSEYSKVRGGLDTHPHTVGFAGTAFALPMLPLIAENYFVLSGRLLSINDMSLIKGGLFDYEKKKPWEPGHKSHREGKDADINQEGIGCDQDRDLRTAVDQLLSPVKMPSGELRSALLCEFCKDTGTMCRKHIDLEFP